MDPRLSPYNAALLQPQQQPPHLPFGPPMWNTSVAVSPILDAPQGPGPTAAAAVAAGVAPASFLGRIFPVVRLRGLPFEAAEDDICDFFQGLDVVDVVIVRRGGRPTGEAFVLFPNAIQAEFALQRSRQSMGRRYIEVFASKKADYYAAVAEFMREGGAGGDKPDNPHDLAGGQHQPYGHQLNSTVGYSSSSSTQRVPQQHQPQQAQPQPQAPTQAPAQQHEGRERGGNKHKHTGVLRMRGLPFSCEREDILKFFQDYRAHLSLERVHIKYHGDGRASGEAFVEFVAGGEVGSAHAQHGNSGNSNSNAVSAASVAAAACAAMDRRHLSCGGTSRYVELFPSSAAERDRSLGRHR